MKKTHTYTLTHICTNTTIVYLDSIFSKCAECFNYAIMEKSLFKSYVICKSTGQYTGEGKRVDSIIVEGWF